MGPMELGPHALAVSSNYSVLAGRQHQSPGEFLSAVFMAIAFNWVRNVLDNFMN